MAACRDFVICDE
ncbi:hypothetical protein CGLO_13923 [Colletotrichum gloeosporioides Cg-14]|uniref:Uncharacterized protein n=1 Tax=Colletotrichum gloeosporioides (strain Cg-14) TaxID=1237896 RepID=T0JVF2_COLGC|nr:hypothetical protein CGLO_13923 [Colletotrichum gloeosporioides Cg-14]